MSAKIQTEIHVRDQRDSKYLWVDRTMIDRDGAMLGPYALAVYMVLAAYAHNVTQTSFPGIERIAEHIGISHPIVRRETKRLEAAGWLARTMIERGKGYAAYVYTLLEAPGHQITIPPIGRPGGNQAEGAKQRGKVLNNVSDGTKQRLPELKTNGTKTKTPRLDSLYEAVYEGVEGTKYIPKQSPHSGLAAALTKALRNAGLDYPDVVRAEYGELAAKNLSATTSADKLVTAIRKRVNGAGARPARKGDLIRHPDGSPVGYSHK